MEKDQHRSSLEIHFDGSLKPSDVRGKDFAEVVEAFEEMITAIVIDQEPDFTKEQIKISLTGVKEGSLKAEFTPNFQTVTIEAIKKASDFINNNQLEKLPDPALSSIQKFISFNKKYECTTNFSLQNGDLRQLAAITSETKIPQDIYIKGETVLYGEITRVGGLDPKIQFKTIAGELLYCAANKSLVKEAGTKLYSQVGVEGIGKWEARTKKLCGFEVTSFLDYQKGSYTQALKQLREICASEPRPSRKMDRRLKELRYDSWDEDE